jgi:hypothetical protein
MDGRLAAPLWAHNRPKGRFDRFNAERPAEAGRWLSEAAGAAQLEI